MQGNVSYWEQTSFFSGYDVIIVGSGIVGLTAAFYLKSKQPKLKVAILESGFLPSGASTKNAGFACFGSISETLDELQTSSEEEVMKVVGMRWNGLKKLKEILGVESTAYEQLGGYEIFKSNDQVLAEECIENIGYLNKIFQEVIGESDIYAVANEKIAGFGFSNVKSMILNRWEAQIDTGKMMRALIHKVESLDVKIFNCCKVLRIENNYPDRQLITEQGRFSTKKVILATNAFVSEFYPELNVVPGRGQVLVTEPIANLKIKGTFHYDKGYYYFRNINNRILLGGGRNIDFKAEETLEPGITGPVQDKLEELLYQTILPYQKPQIQYRWSGVMAFGNKMEPIIRKIAPEIYCAVRCNGMGVAMGSLSGEQVAGLALKEL